MSQALAKESTVGEPRALVAPRVRESQVTSRRRARIRVEAFGHTDIGHTREKNEDSIAVLHELGLFMVADGMGGADAGEVASRLTVDSIREAFEAGDVTRPMAAYDPSVPPSSRCPDTQLLVDAILRAHTHISGISVRNAYEKGMGTTFAGLLVLDDRLVIAHVGDSRVYRLRQHRLDLLTEDHSLLNDHIRDGRWDPADADRFPWPHVVTQAVGTLDENRMPLKLDVTTRDEVPQEGDVYLICSDGLHGMLNRHEIAATLRLNPDVTVAVHRLIELANDGGGIDNISAVVVRIAETGVR